MEPLDRFLTSDAMRSSNTASAASTLGNTAAVAVQDDVEIHTIDTDGRIVFQSKIDVLLDTKSKVAGVGEVLTVQFVFLYLKRENIYICFSNFWEELRHVWDLNTYLKTAIDDFLSLGATDSAVDTNLFITTDTEGTDSVAGLGEDGGLASKLLEHLKHRSLYKHRPNDHHYDRPWQHESICHQIHQRRC